MQGVSGRTQFRNRKENLKHEQPKCIDKLLTMHPNVFICPDFLCLFNQKHTKIGYSSEKNTYLESLQ